jgi:hypothetical protein
VQPSTATPAPVALMLDLGFPIVTSGGDWGATALHTSAYSGSANTVRRADGKHARVDC